MVSKEQLDKFFASEAFGVVGASANRDKYGNKVLRVYLQHGKKVIPVNPREQEIEGSLRGWDSGSSSGGEEHLRDYPPQGDRRGGGFGHRQGYRQYLDAARRGKPRCRGEVPGEKHQCDCRRQLHTGGSRLQGSLRRLYFTLHSSPLTLQHPFPCASHARFPGFCPYNSRQQA